MSARFAYFYDPTDADAAVAADPFVREDLLARYWLKRWDQP